MKLTDTEKRVIFSIGFFASGLLIYFTGDFGILFFILMFVFLGLLIHTSKSSKKKQIERLENSFSSTLKNNNFITDEYYESVDFSTGIAIDNNKERIALLTKDDHENKFNFRQINFNDILEVSIYEDGGLINTVSRGSQVAGALVGGAIAGGVGAIIGSLSGKSKSNEVSNKLSLFIITNDINSPHHEVTFSLGEVRKDSEVYKKSREELNKWFGKLKVIINKNN